MSSHRLGVQGSGHAAADRPMPSGDHKAEVGLPAGIFQRLMSIIAEEVQSLQRHDLSGMPQFSDRKAHCLLELTRLARTSSTMVKTDTAMQQLAQLRQALAANQSLLRIHLQAAGEIAQLLSDAMHRVDGDGTYSPSKRHRGRSP
jgi:hypothetical protein